MNYKLTTDWLRGVVAGGEGQLVEFKEQWYDFDQGPQKAKFLKSMLALGNSVSAVEPGFMIFGIEDAKRGGTVWGVVGSPKPEAVAQVLTSYTQPPVRALFRQIPLDTRTIDVLEVQLEPARPHSATREIPPDLLRNVVYARRGPTIGTLTLPEIEAMIRQKDQQLRVPIRQEPLEAGFIDRGDCHGRKIVARVTNLTDDPVAGLHAMFDIVMRAVPGAFERRLAIVDATLGAGESKEIELDLYSLPVIFNKQRLSLNGSVLHRVVDLTLYVQYRDRGGYIRTIEQHLVLGG